MLFSSIITDRNILPQAEANEPTNIHMLQKYLPLGKVLFFPSIDSYDDADELSLTPSLLNKCRIDFKQLKHTKCKLRFVPENTLFIKKLFL